MIPPSKRATRHWLPTTGCTVTIQWDKGEFIIDQREGMISVPYAMFEGFRDGDLSGESGGGYPEFVEWCRAYPSEVI